MTHHQNGVRHTVCLSRETVTTAPQDPGFHYYSLASAENRALAGLSMGGGRGGMGAATGGTFNAEEHVRGLLTNAQSFNDSLKVFCISAGEQDPRLEATKKAVADFTSHGVKVEFASFPGAHEWQVWRKSLHAFAQRLFK